MADLASKKIMGTYGRLCATCTKGVKQKHGPARQGAKAAKAFEKLASEGDILNSEEATSYRALSARANFLAQDSPDSNLPQKSYADNLPNPPKLVMVDSKDFVDTWWAPPECSTTLTTWMLHVTLWMSTLTQTLGGARKAEEVRLEG